MTEEEKVLATWYVCEKCKAWVGSDENLVGKPCSGEYTVSENPDGTKERKLTPCSGIYRRITTEDLDKISRPYGD